MADPANITPELCRQLLRYEPETGRLFWERRAPELFDQEVQCRRWNTRYAHREAFTSSADGYKRGGISGRWFNAHRIAWAVHYGHWPKGEIDHINGDKGDNRITNLRDVPHAINSRNLTPRKSATGVNGVRKRGNSFSAIVTVNGKEFWLGSYPTLEGAKEARAAADREFGYSPRHAGA